MENPAWNLESEYTGFEAQEFIADREKFRVLRFEMQRKIQLIQEFFHKSPAPGSSGWRQLIESLQQVTEKRNEATILLANMRTFTNCHSSVDGSLEIAKKTASQLMKMQTEMEETLKPMDLFLVRASDELIQEYLQHPATAQRSFLIQEARKKKDYLLSEKEEVLFTALRQPGLQAWGELYNNLCGTMKCEVEIDGHRQSLGLGQTYALLFNADGDRRQAAYRGLHAAWTSHQESAAAVLNALAQFRLEEAQRRSHSQAMDFLTLPLQVNKIQRETLTALMAACEDNAPAIRRSLTAMAKVYGKERLDPWDLNAPAPGRRGRDIPFAEAIQTISAAFRGINPEFGRFVEMMAEKNWIEARVLPNKRQGAYCTGFAKSRTPRVFQTYTGSIKDVTTLAHELGHAYHSWVMRDMPYFECSYPMTLAETASIFAETTLAEHLQKTSTDSDDAFQVAWGDANEAIGLLLNIPARFDFEKSFYEQRASGYCSPRELSELTDKAWKKWYGETLSESDHLFWAHKLHFAIPGISFYNFPYTFGYLFSLSIYARRDSMGAEFKEKYVALLRDTGRMTAEDLIRKHLDEDITRKDFWQKSIDVVQKKVDHFISLT